MPFHPYVRRLFQASILCLVLIDASSHKVKSSTINESVETFGIYVLKHWKSDPELKKFDPPQIVTNVSSGTKILGSCVSKINGKIADDIGGTAYCGSTNTIFVVQDELKPLFKFYGSAAVGYVLAHEYGHYLQEKFNFEYQPIVSELQADCLSGAILGQGAKELDISFEDIISMSQAAYTIGSPSHGTSAQRAYAVYAGFGQSPEITCTIKDIEYLAEGKVKDPLYQDMVSRKRSSNNLNFNQAQEYLRSISGSLFGRD